MDESILLFSRVYLSKFSLETLHFMGIRVFIVGYVKECEKSFFCKTGGFGEWLTTRMSREFQSPNNRMAKLNFLFCSDPAIMTLQLPECSTRDIFGESPLASQSRDPVTRCSLIAHTGQIFTLSHTQPLHNSHLNTWFLIAELQANLARNKANT